MDETEQAHRELERLQGIIDRHEGHIFTLRGWLITVIGALIAAYYAENIHLNDLALRIALPLVALLFIVMELRHINIVEAVAGRATVVEKGLADARRAANANCWYDGPLVSETCKDGAERLRPRNGMTLRLYAPVYRCHHRHHRICDGLPAVERIGGSRRNSTHSVAGRAVGRGTRNLRA